MLSCYRTVTGLDVLHGCFKSTLRAILELGMEDSVAFSIDYPFWAVRSVVAALLIGVTVGKQNTG